MGDRGPRQQTRTTLVRQIAATLIAGLVLLATGCMARVGSDISVPPDAARTCSEQCEDIGLQMTAVAIMANTVGCVCQPRETEGGVNRAAATGVAAGLTTIGLQEETNRVQQANAR
ncbi:MAG: hypothetical protein AAF928_11400 [Myxococcota bacterium]